MRPVEEWTENDLQAFVDGGIPESLYLDYKDSRALSRDKTNEISKDISAFANSAGGRLIYGISERKIEGMGAVPDKIDGGVTDAKVTKEWLEQIILSTISPRIQSVKIKEITLASSGRAYVVDIEQAVSMAPHQASDKKYYRRLNFSSEPMHDYEIRDILHRGQKPQPFLRFPIDSSNVLNSGFTSKFSVQITNAKDEPVLYASIHLYLDARLNYINKEANQILNDNGKVYLQFHSERIEMSNRYYNHMPISHMPIFKETVFKITSFTLSGTIGESYWIGYKITCPGFSGSAFSRFFIDSTGGTRCFNPDEATLFTQIQNNI